MTTRTAEQQHPLDQAPVVATDRVPEEQPSTLVWIDARSATIAQWRDGAVRLAVMSSDVPAHHRSTGHVRHDPSTHHGGGPSTAGEPNRLEHLTRFVELVAQRIPSREPLLILGPGTVRLRLERLVRAADRRRARERGISCQAAPRMSEARLVERLRHFAGADPRRRIAGSYRWAEPAVRLASGQLAPRARPTGEKPEYRPDTSEP
jgi:hypothetical protein